jgi:small multidrug resistance pump
MNLGPWALLGFAIALEIAATTLLKLSNGFERPLYGAASIVLYSACFWALAPALKVLPVGVVYAIWAGAGIAIIALIGAFFFKQTLEAHHYLFIAMIAGGAIGLRLTTAN